MSNRNRIPFKILVTRSEKRTFHVLVVSVLGTPLNDECLRPYAHRVIELIDGLPSETWTDAQFVDTVKQKINEYFVGTEYYQGVDVKDLRSN